MEWVDVSPFAVVVMVAGSGLGQENEEKAPGSGCMPEQAGSFGSAGGSPPE